MPLRVRVALIFAAATAVLLAVGGFVFLHQLTTGIEQSIDSTLTTRAADIANAVVQPGTDPSTVLEASRHAPLPLGGSEAQVLDERGDVLSASGSSQVPMVDAALIARANDQPLRFTAGPDDQQRFIVVSADHDGERLAIVVRSALEGSDEAIDHAERLLVFAGALLVLLAGVAGWVLAGATLRPVERMRSQVAEMTEDELGPSLDVPRTKDEIAALATTMNDLLGRVRGARRRERRFIAEAGHELRTPLAILQGELELANRPGRSEDELREAMRVAHDESLRLGRLAEELLVLARTDAGAMELHRRPTDLGALVERSVTALGPQAEQREVSVRLACTVDEPVDLDPDRFRQAVDNLLVNALHHAPSGTTIDVVVERRGPDVACIVRDEGPGFPPDFLDQAFDRFAKPPSQAGGGAGLGLSIVRSIASAHDGRAWVANRPEAGAEAGLTVGRTRPTEAQRD